MNSQCVPVKLLLNCLDFEKFPLLFWLLAEVYVVMMIIPWVRENSDNIKQYHMSYFSNPNMRGNLINNIMHLDLKPPL